MGGASVVQFQPGSRKQEEIHHKFGYRSLLRHIRELLGYNLWGSLFFISGIIVGFIHGWLKLKHPGLVVQVAYDALIIGSMIATTLVMRKGTSFFPKSAVANALVFQFVVCGIYLFISFEVPFIISLASLRGWCLAPLGFFLGYHLTRSVRQMEVFILMLIFLGTATAIYGIFFQTAEEIQAMIEANPELRRQFEGIYYATSTGAQFRSFSTFVTPAAFGGTMAYCVMFAFSRMTVPGCPKWERIVLFICAALMAYGILLSGSRTALIITIIGLGVTAWYRRSFIRFAVIPGVLGFVVVIIAEIFREGVSERFASLGRLDEVWGRFAIVYKPALHHLGESFMGGGLGRSGHGVPGFLSRYNLSYDSRFIDGDLGRIIVDFGIIGLFMFFFIAISGIKDSVNWLVQLRDTSPGIIALPCTAMFALNLVMWPTGSPFLAIPGGVLTWFFMGSVRRILDEYLRFKATASDRAAESDEFFVSFLSTAKQPKIYQVIKSKSEFQPQGERLATRSSRPKYITAGAAPKTTRRRFLYRRD